MTQSAVPASVVTGLVAAARGYARVSEGNEAGVLERLAATAVVTAEAYCGCAIFARAHEDVLAVAPGWQRLRATPVTAIAGVTALPDASVSSATPTGAEPFVVPVGDYQIDIDANGDGWVRVAAAGGAGRVAVSYQAGLAAEWAGCPSALAQGLVMLVAHLFADREGQVPPAAVAALWRPFRRMRLMEPVK